MMIQTATCLLFLLLVYCGHVLYRAIRHMVDGKPLSDAALFYLVVAAIGDFVWLVFRLLDQLIHPTHDLFS